jgi:hypothetical protein
MIDFQSPRIDILQHIGVDGDNRLAIWADAIGEWLYPANLAELMPDHMLVKQVFGQTFGPSFQCESLDWGEYQNRTQPLAARAVAGDSAVKGHTRVEFDRPTLAASFIYGHFIAFPSPSG